MSVGQRRALWIAAVALVVLGGLGAGVRGCGERGAEQQGASTDTGRGTGKGTSADGGTGTKAEGYELSGAVIDDLGRVVGGAVVEALRMRDGQWAAIATSASDENGGFTLRELPMGEYEVRARKLGFSDEAASGIAVPVKAKAPPVQLTLERTGVLRGRVLEDTGKPAKGATVTLRDTGAARAPTAVADEDGTFALPGLPAGVYGAQARLGVFVSEVQDGIDLQAGSEAWIDLQLAASAALTGSVVDRETQEPAAGARLVFDPGVLGPAGETATVGADGAFSVAGLRVGSVRVVAEAPGYVPASGLGQAGGAALVIQLDRAATLSGVVLDEAGEPVRGAELEVLAEGAELAETFAGGIALASSDNLGVTVGAVPKIPISGGAAPMTLVGGAAGAGPAIWETGPDGSFEITPVGPGRVRVAAHHPELSPGETAPIEVSAGAAISGLRITLEAGGMLVGDVRDASDAPAAGIAIELQLDAGELRRTTVTDGSGHFELGPVRGSGVVIAHPPGEPAVQAEVEIGAGEEVPVLLRLSGATARITGEVSGSAGEPLVATVVRVRVPDAAPPLVRTAVTDAQGHFAIDGLPLERCRLEVEHPDHAPFAIDVVPGGPPVEVALSEGARVLAEVRDAIAGTPLAGAVVTLRAISGGAPLRGRTDRAGKIEFRSVTIDTYLISIEHHGFGAARLESAVESAEVATELGVIELMPTGSAAGQVVDRYGSTVAGAEVAAGEPPRWQLAVRSGRDGRFRLGALAEGDVVLTARTRSGSYSEPVEVRIETGEETGGLVLRLPTAEDSAEVAPEPVEDSMEIEGGDEPDKPARPAGPKTPPGVAITLAYAQGEIRVAEVLSASAKAAGLQVGDVLAVVDGEAVLAASQGRALLRGTAGTVAAIEVKRGGKRVRLRAPREASPGW